MRTPDEIKKGLYSCGTDECHGQHTDCPYNDGHTEPCIMNVCGDALTYIKQLEGQIDHMLDYMHGDCGACKHRNVHGLAGTTCGDCVMEWERPNWEYAGEADEKENNNV